MEENIYSHLKEERKAKGNVSGTRCETLCAHSVQCKKILSSSTCAQQDKTVIELLINSEDQDGVVTTLPIELSQDSVKKLKAALETDI
ncbi:hypothetical protein HZS_5037 [Henneguya salminicola]|nr:hypothetical protein HZS_5037 [Henneguya salminicola]